MTPKPGRTCKNIDIVRFAKVGNEESTGQCYLLLHILHQCQGSIYVVLGSSTLGV